ncbi:hypothetical protein FHS83_003399 [Rhizomicrobium palustre]|uniref:Uncharacterized protein n=1 Tax=Rhizomicrobium palustre TaxID=189966 RepID=A0A846N4E4_9PROT|nr:hypothetical protein [Rhizomicrobium palustre]NIK90081.1 hypothetical protein [Rhizomicrobium palustre]
MNVIEFENIKARAGASWSRVCEGVYSRIEALLNARIGPNDIFVRIGEAAYLVSMPGIAPDEVSAVCTRVAFDLQTSFLGQCVLQDVVVDVASSASDDTLQLSRISSDRIITLAARGGVPEEVLRKAVAGSQVASAADAFATQTPSTAPVVVNKAVAPPRANDASGVQCKFHYVPIWAVPSTAVTSYGCEARDITVSGRPGTVLLSQLSLEERIEVELATLRDGIAKLEATLNTPQRFLLAVPLSFNVLGVPAGRVAVLAACKGLSFNARNFMSFIIYDVPLGVAQSRLVNMVNTLRPFARSVLATVACGTRTLAAYEGIGLRGAGYNLTEFPANTSLRQHDIEQLALFARRAGLATFLWGLSNKAELRIAQDAGIHYISGAAIQSACPEPKGVFRLTWGEVLTQPVTELWV